MTSQAALHPELKLPYGRWIPIAGQRKTAAIWYNYFAFDEMALMEKLVEHGQGWIMQRKVKDDDKGEEGHTYERVLWIKTPAEITRQLAVDGPKNTL